MKSICTLIVCSAFLSGAALAETITFDDVKRGTAAGLDSDANRQRSANGLWRKMTPRRASRTC